MTDNFTAHLIAYYTDRYQEALARRKSDMQTKQKKQTRANYADRPTTLDIGDEKFQLHWVEPRPGDFLVVEAHAWGMPVSGRAKKNPAKAVIRLIDAILDSAYARQRYFSTQYDAWTTTVEALEAKRQTLRDWIA